MSDSSRGIDVGLGEAGQTLLTLAAKNADPENAIGVKLSTYYQTTLFHANSIQVAGRTDRGGGWGIIECFLGTTDAGSEEEVAL